MSRSDGPVPAAPRGSDTGEGGSGGDGEQGPAGGPAAADQARRRLESIIENTPDAVITTDVTGRIDGWNPAAERLFGYRPEEIIGQFAQVLFPLATDDNAAEFRGVVAAGGTRTPLTAPIRRRDGSVSQVSVAASPFDDDDGLAGFALTARDITDELRVLEQLQRSEARFQQVIETTREGFWVIDHEGFTTMVNEPMASMLGYRIDEMTGRHFSDFLVPGDQAPLADLYAARLPFDTGHYEVRLAHRDGSTLDVRVAYSALHKAEGVRGDDGVLSVVTDITATREVEARLRLQASLLASIHEAVIATDIDGTVRYVNPAGRRMLGWSDDFDPEGHQVLDLARAESSRAMATSILEHLRVHDSWSGEFLFEAPGAPPTPWLVQASVLGPGRDDAVVVALIIDLTERRRAERRAQLYADQQAVVARLGRFSSSGRPLSVLCQDAVEDVRTVLGVDTTNLFLAADGGSLTRLVDAVGAYPTADASLALAATDLFTDDAVLDRFRAGEVVPAPGSGSDAADGAGPPADGGLRGWVAVGITDGHDLFGLLTAATVAPRAFTEEEGTFLQAVAAVLGAAFARQQAARTLAEAEQSERQRLAEALHDDPLQVMTAAALRLELFSRMRALPEQRATIDALVADIRMAATRMRNLMFDLSPDDFDDVDLGDLLVQVLEHASEDCGFTYDLDDQLTTDLDEVTSMIVFRTVQESIVNIRKHAHASKVLVHLQSVEGGTACRVEDDGVGFDVAQSERRTGHLGLRSMRSRIQRAGGRWSVRSKPGAGTTIEFFVPDPPTPGT